MEYSDRDIHSEEFDSNRVGFLLESAALAEQGGNSRLAIHLYCAAFEASQANEDGVDERTLNGLRQAWLLACQQGDRSTAETIFNDLVPYNSDEQTQAALAELQQMAMGQLGLDKEEMEDLAIALADEIRDAGIDVKALTEQFEEMTHLPTEKVNLANLASTLMGGPLHDGMSHTGASEALELPDSASRDLSVEESPFEPHYDNLPGYERTKEKMRVYGIVDPSDTEMRGFLHQAESFHGITGPVLTQNFLFVGTSREDTGIFAQATANEIGWPVVTMIVDVNEFGDGTIKVMAPVRRSFFGPPRITDFPNPCTLVIQNVDILQDMFWGEEQAISRGYNPPGCRHSDDNHRPHDMQRPGGMQGMPGMSGMHAGPHRSLQHEITGYLSALFARGGVFVIATSAASTAEQPLVLSEQLDSLLGKPVEIEIDTPTLEERQRVLSWFSKEHPSFHDLELSNLAHLSNGMSRYEIFMSCRQAVEMAYSESLKTQCHQMVSLEDIYSQFFRYLPQDSVNYRLVEDYLVAKFTADLETEMLQYKIGPSQMRIDPNQIRLNLDNDDADGISI